MPPFDSLKRGRLRRQGMASPRRRLHERKNALWGKASHSGWLRLGLVLLFTLATTLLVTWPEPLWDWQVIGGNAVRHNLALVLVTVVLALLALSDILERNEKVVLVGGVLLLQFVLSVTLSQGAPPSKPELHDYLPFILPYAVAPLLLTLLIDERAGTAAAFLSALWQPYLLEQGDDREVFTAAALVGFGAVLMSGALRNRRQLLRTGLLLGAIHFLVAALFGELILPRWGEGWVWQWLLTQAALAAAAGIGTTIAVVTLLPVFESIFRLTSPPTWIELTDLNQPLLRRLAIETPGTYHHSLQVANLAEAAAEAVGADATRCRVCAYFHDIGKLEKPGYFIENQGAENPHDQLTPTMSALVILSHVKDGVSLALKNRLNQDIIDVIKEHHGTSLVSYFHHKALKLREEALAEVTEGKRNEEDVPRVSKDSFRYPGPRPRTAESAIISLADSIESASRSLEKVTPARLEQLVNDLVLARIEDAQLDECGLTMRELGQIKESFIKSLRTMHHHRISYPGSVTEQEETARSVAEIEQDRQQHTWGGRRDDAAPPRQPGDGRKSGQEKVKTGTESRKPAGDSGRAGSGPGTRKPSAPATAQERQERRELRSQSA